MERCSCCNARLGGALICPRCQTNLAAVISSEQQANALLAHAMQLWFIQERKLAVQTLTQALGYKKTPAILIFRDFIIRQYGSKIVALLAHGKHQHAQYTLTLLIKLHPTHPLLLQLRGFTNHLIAKSS
ncbi:hypothetical protein [Crenothrix polyspora]|jgi:hypothetical protein|uniref:Uncharacterized protein n=1 Tax=Crenothrix polyspora TaxID=360316 RepID=A0A1R4HE07_9GAMM|nr:hypothetical protein [Crenothrix polyspora]SJM94261.1 conserved hypothetical protein [Crenothrix polyspora]